ncbi:MAG: helix-hairpin-helix domain-containing protein [Bacteroidota bacterium]
MPNKLNIWFKPFFSLNKSEQRGIIILVILILLLAVVNLLLPYLVESRSESNLKKYKSEIESFIGEQQHLIDSANIEFLQNSGEIDRAFAIQKIRPFKFNPNKLPVEAWKKMGFTSQQIRTIKNYEAKGGKFKRKEDVKKMYSISDIEYEIIEPYIHIPSAYKSSTGKAIKKKPSSRIVNYKTTEVNSADYEGLQSSLGLSSWLAKRTISYKNALGGFVNKEQLKEVYGINDSIYAGIKKYLIVDTSLIQKIDINNIEFKRLLKHPYFDYNTTKTLFNTRDKIGSFSSINQIKLIEEISDSTMNKISPYLYFK